ncbi:MAG TPA: hypothetical protein DIC60_03190 [Lachnospiraceae bacterium]|nr:hypothetical protein [Lachnospiraceae bacterium]
MGTIENSMQMFNVTTKGLRSVTDFLSMAIASFQNISMAASNCFDVSSIQDGKIELTQTEAVYNKIEEYIRKVDQQEKTQTRHLRTMDTVKQHGLGRENGFRNFGLNTIGSDELHGLNTAVPMVMQTVADYMNMTIDKSKEMVNSRGITAEIVKNAMFDMAHNWSAIEPIDVGVDIPLRDNIYDRIVDGTVRNIATSSTSYEEANSAYDSKNDIISNTSGIAMDSLFQKAADTVAYTGGITSDMEISDEDLKYLRDVAVREAIDHYTTAQIAVDFKNTATINSDMDIDSVMNKFTEKLREAVDISAEEVHYLV